MCVPPALSVKVTMKESRENIIYIDHAVRPHRAEVVMALNGFMCQARAQAATIHPFDFGFWFWNTTQKKNINPV